MKRVHKRFDDIRFYGIFGLMVVAFAFYIVFWGVL